MVRGMKRLMAFFVVFTLLFQMTDMPLHAENSRDVSALLTVKEAYIETKSQGCCGKQDVDRYRSGICIC